MRHLILSLRPILSLPRGFPRHCRYAQRLLVALLLLLPYGVPAHASETNTTTPLCAPPGVSLNRKEQELADWITSQLRTAKVADLRLLQAPLDQPTPNTPVDRRGTRAHVSPALLDYLLRNNELRDIRLAGATFLDPLCMESQSISKPLVLIDSLFMQDVRLHNTSFNYDLTFDGSRFEKHLDLSGATVRGTLSLRSVSVKGDLDFRHAVVEQDLIMNKSDSSSTSPRAERTVIGGQWIANSASVSGEIYADHAWFFGPVAMQFLRVGEDMNFRHGAEFRKKVELRSSRINGRLTLAGVRMRDMDLSNASIGDNLILCGAEVRDGSRIDLRHAEIGNDLDLRGSNVDGYLIARATQIQGDLLLDFEEGSDADEPCDAVLSSRESHPRTEIGDMVLRDARVAMLRAHLKELRGGGKNQTFKRLEIEGLLHNGFDNLADIAKRDSASSYLKWLGQDATFSPQPYQHLAALLRERGEYGQAHQILFHSRQREREEACRSGDWATCVGLWTLEIFVGYGIGARGALTVLIWIVGLSTIGAVLIWRGVQRREMRQSFGWSLWASLDYMLPLVSLDDRHNTFISEELKVWAKQMLYLQAVFGWVLASFVVAALAGLTQGS
jgi:hypothetical protein